MKVFASLRLRLAATAVTLGLPAGGAAAYVGHPPGTVIHPNQPAGVSVKDSNAGIGAEAASRAAGLRPHRVDTAAPPTPGAGFNIVLPRSAAGPTQGRCSAAGHPGQACPVS
jgi:hypothetical protein